MSRRGFTITKQIRLERRKQAEARQAEYDKLTLQQKIDRLPAEPAAKKQRARLLKALEKQNAPKPEPKTPQKQEAPETTKKTHNKKNK